MSLSLTLLGGFGIEANGSPLPLPARKARALLAALALARHRSLTRAHLARLLWGGRSAAEQARGSLRQTLTRIRRAGVELVTTDPDSVSLPGSIEIDVDAFCTALARGDAAEAIRAYRGDLMEGLAFRDASIDDWLARERARLRALAIGAFAAELDRLEDRPEAAELAHRLLELDPLRERAHRALMRLDVARGDTSAALARFTALRDLLHRELETMPEAQTMVLAERIRTGRLARSGNEAGVVRKLTDGSVTPDVHIRQVVVLAALEAADTGERRSTDTGDWIAVLVDAVVAAGGTVTRSESGQVVAVWGLEQTREADAATAADMARTVLRHTGSCASIGLAEGSTEVGDARASTTRMANRALRLAAVAVPGTLALEPHLAERLTRPLRPEPTLVGREAELGQVLGAARAALGDGRGLVIHVGGEAGIGKTRLAREIAASLVASGTSAIWVGFESFGTTVHLGQQIATALSDGPRPAIDDPFDRAILAALEGRTLTAGDRLRLDALVPDERLRRELAVTDALLGAAATPEGLFLVVEDCHWAHHAARSYLLELTDAAARHPVVLLLSERPSDESLGPRLATRARASLVRLALAPLSGPAAERLARSVSVEEPRVLRALALAGGHPLFLLRLLETELADERLPSTISALVQEQIERMPVGERAALRHASILGRQFSPDDVRNIFDSASPTPSGDLLIADGERALFGHDLIHRAVYESVPEALRRELHGRAAAYYRDRDPLRWVDHAEVSDDDADATRAAAAAANAMIAARRFSAAVPFLDAGLARAGDPEAVAELHSCRAAVRRIRGDLHGALDDYRAAYAHALLHATSASMLTRMALVLQRLDRRSEAERALDDAEDIVDRAGIGGVVRAEIFEQRGNLAFSRADHEACAGHHAAALALAESVDDHRAVARAHGGLGDAAYAVGRMATACSHYEQAIRIGQAGGFGMVIEDFGAVYAYAHHLLDPGPRAAVLADLAVEGARNSGAVRNEIIARMIRADMRLAALDFAGAAEDMDRITGLQSAVGREQRFEEDLSALRALLAYRRGDRIAVDGLIDSSGEPDGFDARTAGLRLGVVALAGSAPARERAIELGAELAGAMWLAHGVIRFHRLVLESALRRDEPTLARAEIEALRDYTAPEPLAWVEFAIEHAQLYLAPDATRAGEFALRAEAAGIRDLPPL